MRLTLNWQTESGRWPSSMWVGLIQSLECLNRTKLWRKRESSLPLSSVWDVNILLPLDSDLDGNLHHWLYLLLRPSNPDWNYAICSLGSTACPVQIWRLHSLQICTSQFLIMYLYISICIYVYKKLAHVIIIYITYIYLEIDMQMAHGFFRHRYIDINII